MRRMINFQQFLTLNSCILLMHVTCSLTHIYCYVWHMCKISFLNE